MKIKLLNLITAMVIALQSIAQSGTSENGLLWEISGKGLQESSYLYGTYHLMGKSFTDTLPGLMKAFQHSKLIVGEVVIEDEMAMAQKMMPYMTLQGKGLNEILSPSEFSEVDAVMTAKTGAPLTVYNAFKPTTVQILLVAKIAPGNISPDNPGLDIFFQKEGAKNGKKVAGLETIEKQSALLLNTPIEKQKEDLLKTVRENERYANESKKLFDAYKSENLSEIEKLIRESPDSSAEQLKTLLIDRNKEWVKLLPDFLNKGNVFLAVGAGHLPGKEGIIELLKTAGYTVRPVSLK
ncbi:TraB/GumN family protein [Desertivirga arenae]|uniref:TraB/GumN family protein n=1 Tax=Desertivirga arenae TaxID=2810309 RepID=UPI001A970B67|nr:TraB/GumN family protein [Pedobacter sp. SYSU D00823]